MDKSEERIRERAFQIWIEEGQPDGKHKEHWERAEKEVSKAPNGSERLIDAGEGRPPIEG